MGDRVLIIGLDGLDLADAGRGALAFMPYLSSLAERYSVERLPVVLPNNSVACWQSWFTGSDPSRHGLPDFYLFDWTSARHRLASSADRTAPTLWEIASQRGQRCIVFNAPGTFPAQPLNGLMIAGSPVAARQGLTYPDKLPGGLAALLDDYRSDLDFEGRLDAGGAESLAASMQRIHCYHLRVMHALLEQQWDLFVGVLTMTDRLLHFFLPALADGPAPLPSEAKLVRQCFTELDEFLCDVISRFEQRARIVLIADHGFQPCLYQFRLADWLQSRGWLFADRASQSDPAGFEAFCADMERSLFLPAPASSIGLRYNRRLILSHDQQRAARAALKQGLLELRGPDGLAVFERVIERDELYSGAFASRLPDLLLVTRNGQIALTSRTGPTLFDPPDRPGIHSLSAARLDPGQGNLEPRGWRGLFELLGF